MGLSNMPTRFREGHRETKCPAKKHIFIRSPHDASESVPGRTKNDGLSLPGERPTQTGLEKPILSCIHPYSPSTSRPRIKIYSGGFEGHEIEDVEGLS